MSGEGVVLITGSGSGFGLLTAKALLRRGYAVVASMRDPEAADRQAKGELEALAGARGGSVQVPEIDVASDASVEAGVAAALERWGRIDVAVNNAGVGLSGPAEAFTAAEFRRLLEINLLGPQRINRAVLPSMRARGSGLLVHVSSTFGRFAVPWAAPYTASKWALEALAESYHRELAGTGVDAVLIQPGPFETGHGDAIERPADAERVASYGELAEVADRMWAAFLEALRAAAPDPQAVADAIVRTIESPAGERPLRVVVDLLTGGHAVEQLNRISRELWEPFAAAMGIAGVLRQR